jgi:hypothetical protein
MGTDFHKDGQIRPAAGVAPEIAVALLTGGSDRLCLRPRDGADVQGAPGPDWQR